MQPQFVVGSPLLEIAWAAGLLLVSALVAWLVLLGIHRQERRLQKVAKSTLPSQLLKSLARPVFLLVVSQGLLLSLSSVSYLAGWRPFLTKLSFVVLIVLVTYSLSRTVSLLLDGYLHSRVIRRKARLDEGLIRFLQRLLVIVVYALGFLIVLDYLKISLTPFIAGLGIGGLAVALALQPTLANFFASTLIVSDRVARVGDYIELDDGKVRGYVDDVGWRSTRIRTVFNNMVTIPNSVLANSIITNFYAPNAEMGFVVNCGVSYSSNLAQVEEVALEVAREVIQELDEAAKTAEPWFGYEEFGDSNINFWVWLQATDRVASFRLKSEFIKRLKTRFDREGITINYPVRTTYLHLPNGTPLGFVPSNTPSFDDSKKKD